MSGPGAMSWDTGSFDCVRLAPLFAQDDKDFFLDPAICNREPDVQSRTAKTECRKPEAEHRTPKAERRKLNAES